jgi:succinyl-diaminopimelate desuccinylase
MEKILERLISIDSRTEKPGTEMINYLRKTLPGKLKIIEYNNRHYTAVLKIGGRSSRSPIIFVGHTDTVPPVAGWRTNPFRAVKKSGKIYGLGASDMKAGIAVMIKLAQEIKTPEKDVYFIFTGDEETNCSGSKKAVEYLKNIKSGNVILLEPTDGDITYGQKTTIQYEIEVSGKARHSSRTSYIYNQRHNAIIKAAKIINELNNLDRELDRKSYGKFGKLSQNVGVIAGGTASNVVPDRCLIKVNYRLPPELTLKQLDGMIRRKIKGAKITAGEPRIYFLTSKNSEFAKRLLSLAKKEFPKSRMIVTYGWTEAGILKNLGECLIFGPGDKKCIHSANELVEIANMDKCYRILRELIE